MSILSRFKEIIASNLNALLDKAEDPQKMIEQYLKELTGDLAEVKRETASVMADEAKAKRNLVANQEEVVKYTQLARKALEAGDEANAKVFIKKKQSLEEVGETLQQVYDVAASNSQKMRQMHDKLVNDLNELHTRKAAIEAKIKIAEAQKKVNEVAGASAANKAEASLNAFARMEEKVDHMLDEANAMAELSMERTDDAIAAEAKYYEAISNSKVDAELEAMKAELGLLEGK
ncbi:MAG: PspA/IM30 family protein [Lachnospiraceae bacterium]|nr:PspA/IM30 family protein [Lachnospiraceae bacterium]